MSLSDHQNPDGTYNGATALAELSGLSTDYIKQVAEAVRANVDRLSSCQYHEFERIPHDQGVLRRKAYRCVHCGGEVDHAAYAWHEDGRRPKPTTPETAKD